MGHCANDEYFEDNLSIWIVDVFAMPMSWHYEFYILLVHVLALMILGNFDHFAFWPIAVRLLSQSTQCDRGVNSLKLSSLSQLSHHVLGWPITLCMSSKTVLKWNKNASGYKRIIWPHLPAFSSTAVCDMFMWWFCLLCEVKADISWHQESVTARQDSNVSVTCIATDLDFLDVVRVELLASNGVVRPIADMATVKPPFLYVPRYLITVDNRNTVGNLTITYQGMLLRFFLRLRHVKFFFQKSLSIRKLSDVAYTLAEV